MSVYGKTPDGEWVKAERSPGCDCTDPDCPTRAALATKGDGMGNRKLVTVLWNDDALMVHVDASMKVSELAERASRWFGTIPGDRPVLSDHGDMLRDEETVDAAMSSTVVYELVLIGGNV